MEASRYKFRVWDVEAEAYVMFNPTDECVLDVHLGIVHVRARTPFGLMETRRKYTLEQCTGWADKNGTPIYENDIVTDGTTQGCVYWADNCWGVTNFLWQNHPSQLIVIGNAHSEESVKKTQES